MDNPVTYEKLGTRHRTTKYKNKAHKTKKMNMKKKTRVNSGDREG